MKEDYKIMFKVVITYFTIVIMMLGYLTSRDLLPTEYFYPFISILSILVLINLNLTFNK